MSSSSKLELNAPHLGNLTWEIPEPLAGIVQNLDDANKQKALEWLKHQTEGFILALLATQDSPRKFKNFETTVADLVVEALLPD